MQYPSEFPHDARARVEAETRRAYIALEQDVRGMESWRRNVPFLRCVMRIFLAFAREACKFGMKSHHPAWSDCELDQRCRDSLLEIVIDAWEHKAKDLGINKMFSSQGWGYSINDDDRRKIEKSPEWKQYQDLLIEAFQVERRRGQERCAELGVRTVIDSRKRSSLKIHDEGGGALTACCLTSGAGSRLRPAAWR